MTTAEKFSHLHKVTKNATASWARRELGESRRATGPPQCLEWAAEEKLILKIHQEFPCNLPDGSRSTFLMIYSPDGSMIASTHGNHDIYVTDARSGRLLKTLSGHPRTPWCIAFHPSSNQILASGCLGGQVRVWDLHGGSEIWNSENQTVIASLTFHPTDRVLVIASYNEILFWDWSQERPFAQCSTANAREKVRYVSFDQHGHKLVTGIANIQPRQSQWDRVAAPQPSPHTVSQLDHERRITICYRYMVEQYEQLVERYIQLSSQGPGGSTNYYLRRVPVPPQTIDRGTDPMDETSPSTSSGVGQQVRCSVCQGDLIGSHCTRPSTSSNSDSSPSSNVSASSSPLLSEESPAGARRPENVRRPRGTNEISASHSSSLFLNTSAAHPRPQPSDSSSPLSGSLPNNSSPLDRPLLPGEFVSASTLFERLNRFRAQVVSGRNILTRTRTISRLSPSAPEDVNYLIDDPLSESLPSRPALGVRHILAPRRHPHLPRSQLHVPSNVTPALRSQTVDNGVDPLDNNSSLDTSNSPSREDEASRQQSPMDVMRNLVRLGDLEVLSHTGNSSQPQPSSSSSMSQHVPIASEGTSSSQPGDRESPNLICPRGCRNPQSPSELANRRRWTPQGLYRSQGRGNYGGGCLRHSYRAASIARIIEQRSSFVDLDSSDLSSSSSSSPSIGLSSQSGESPLSAGLDPTPTFPPLPPNSPPPRATDPLFSPRPVLDHGTSSQADASMPHTEDAGSSSGSDSSSAIARLRAQFRRLQSVYNDNRDRESQLLRVAAQNAERRLMSRLTNLFGRGVSGRSVSSSLFEPGHDLRSIRYGLQLLRRNIYTMARVYRFIVDRRRLDRIWRLWLDLQCQIFFLQRAVRDEESDEVTPSPSQLDEPLNNSSASTDSNATPNRPSGSRTPTSPVFVRVTPSFSSFANSSSRNDNQNPPSQPSFMDSLPSPNVEDNVPYSPRNGASSSSGLPLLPPRRFRFCRSHQRPFRRPRFDHPHRVPGRGLLGYGVRAGSHNQPSTTPLNGTEEAEDDEECDLLNRPYDPLRSGNLRKKARYRATPAPSSLVSESHPSSSRHPLPLRSARGRSQCNRVRIFPRLNEVNDSPQTNQNRSAAQSSEWRSSDSERPGPSSWSPESLRSRARHMLLLMLDSLTQFFENDSLIRSATAENSNERVTNLTSLLELASNLTKLLLTQLRNSRAIRDVHTPRRRVLRGFMAYSSHSAFRNDSPGSNNQNTSDRVASGSSGSGGANPESSQGAAGMRLPLLMVNDSPVPPEPDAGPDPPLPPVPPRSYSPSFFSSQFQSSHFFHSHHPAPPPPPVPLDESSDEYQSPHDRNDVLYLNIGFPNGSGPPLFSTEASLATHHRVQVWDFSKFALPEIECSDKNVVVPECKIHNDASVDISKDGSIIVTLLPAGRLSHITTMLGVYSLSWDSLGQCLYTTSFEQNAVSVSLSPTNRHLAVGLASRRTTFLQSERQIAAQIFRLEGGKVAMKTDSPASKGKLALLREIIRESSDYTQSINCIRWSPVPGQGFIFGTNSGKLKIIR